MKATVSILARVPEGDGYRLQTVEKKRGSYVKPENAIAFYIRYTDGTSRKRQLVAAGKNFGDAVVRAINIETIQNATRNGHQAPVAEVTSKSDRLTIAAAVEQWTTSFEARLAQWRGGADNGLSKNSIAAYTKTAEDFLAYCNQHGIVFMPKSDKTGQQAPDEVNAELLSAYETYLRTNLPIRHNQKGEAKDRQGSIVTRFRNLGVFFGHFDLLISERADAHDGRGILKRAKYPRINKAKKHREAQAKKSQTVLIYSQEEINAMLSVANQDERDLIKFLLETGVRDKEAAHAEWSDVDGANLNLRDKPRYDWRLKDKERRTLPLNPKLIARLKARRARQEREAKADGRETSTLIFPNTLGNPDLALDERIHKVVARAKKAEFAWDAEVGMHKFRKNFATFMHRAGCDLATIRDLLGHSDIKTTELYIATDGSRAADVSRVAFQAFGD